MNKLKHRVKRDEVMFQGVIRVLVMITFTLAGLAFLGFLYPYVVNEFMSTDSFVVSSGILVVIAFFWFDTVVQKAFASSCEICRVGSVKMSFPTRYGQVTFKCDACGATGHVYE